MHHDTTGIIVCRCTSCICIEKPIHMRNDGLDKGAGQVIVHDGSRYIVVLGSQQAHGKDQRQVGCLHLVHVAVVLDALQMACQMVKHLVMHNGQHLDDGFESKHALVIVLQSRCFNEAVIVFKCQ